MKYKALSTGNIFENKYIQKKIILPKLNRNLNIKPFPLLRNYIFNQSLNEKKKIDDSLKSIIQQSFIITKKKYPITDSSNLSNELSSSENKIKIQFDPFENKKVKKKIFSLSKIYKRKNNSESLNNKLDETINLFKLNTEHKSNNINLMFMKNKFPIAALINRKEINKIPIYPNLPLTYKNKFANHSEYNRFMKFNEELLKLREQITIDYKNTFKYLKEFINFYGIKDECFYKNNYLCNLSNFVKSNFINKINPNFSLRQNLIHALMEGAVVNTGFLEEEKIFISPYIKKTLFKKYPNRNILNKKEIMSVIDLEKQKILNERLN